MLSNLKLELKKLIVEECYLKIDPLEIKDDDILFGEDSRFGFDSIDYLQVIMALGHKYKLKIAKYATNKDEALKVVRTVDCIAVFVDEHKGERIDKNSESLY